MTTNRVAVGLYVPTDHYRALTKIAEDKGVQVHTLIEGLVARALVNAPAASAPRKLRPRVRIDPDEFLSLYGERLSDREIAERMGTGRDTIGSIRKRYNLPANRKRADFDEVEMRRLHAEKLTDRAIAERMGVAPATIGYHRNRLNLPKNVRDGRPRIHYPRQDQPPG